MKAIADHTGFEHAKLVDSAGLRPDHESAAVALALVAIVLRRFAASPVARPGTARFLALGSLLASAGLGLLGAGLAFETGARETGLLFTLAGLIFALRVPRPNLGGEHR